MPGKFGPGAMVCTPPPPMLNPIVSVPVSTFASWIAARNVHSPAVAVRHPWWPGFASGASPVEFTTSAPGGGAGGATAPLRVDCAPREDSPGRNAAPTMAIAIADTHNGPRTYRRLILRPLFR